jgi:hypothetical protein
MTPRSAADVLFGDAVPSADDTNGAAPGKASGTNARSTPSRPNPADVLFGTAGKDANTTTADAVARPATTPERKRNPADVLFGDAVTESLDLRDNLHRVADAQGLSIAQQAEELREFATVTSDFGLTRQDAEHLHAVYTRRRLEGDTDDWVTQAQHWATASRRALRERYGPAEAESLLHALDALMESHPGLQRILEGGVGANPRIVEMFAEHVRRGR